LFLLILPFSLQAPGTIPFADAQTVPGKFRIIFADSVREILPGGPKIASGASATMVRSALTQAEINATTEFSIPLKMRDFDGLQKRIGEGEIISLDEMAAEYYPTPSDYKLVADWLVVQGFVVKPPDKYNLSVFASGSVAQLEQAFGTKFARITVAGVESSSALTAPSLPATIAGPVLGINGLQPQMHPKSHSQILPRQPQSLTNNLPPYQVSEIAKAYGANGLSVNGNGQKIAIVIDTFPASSDLISFWQGNAIAQSLNNIEKVQVVGGILPPPSLEATLDVEWSSGMAPGAKVRVYATTDLQFVHIDAAYQAIINELPSQPTMHQVSLSYGLGETEESTAQMQTDAQYFATLAAGGVTVFVSSGDGGSSPGGGFEDNTGLVQVECPANDPNVTSVGGTSLHLTATGAVSSESAWSFGGGGSSHFFARPAWQTGAGVPVGAFRTVPDVALTADLNTAGYLFFQGQVEGVGGTSWGAPTWAAFSAMINQARANVSQLSAGLLGPKIYKLNSTSSFRQITTGSNGPNGIYTAGLAYNLCTGLGVPSVANLIQALTGLNSTSIVTVPNPPDFDGDGKQDFLWRNASNGQVGVWLMNGSVPKATAVIGSTPLSWVIINTGDFDGAGKSDILWQSGNSSQYGVWFMNGVRVSRAQGFTLPPYAGQICCVADFDGDGLADLVSFNRPAGALYFWKNTGSLRFVLQTSYAVSGWLPIGTAQLNGPGTPPALIWRNASTGVVAAWFMSAFTLNSTLVFGNPGNDVVLRGFGDFSGDGKADILLFNTSTNIVGYWQSKGAQQPGTVQLAQASGNWVPVGAENLDGAGNAEIIWRQSSTGTLGAWQVSGSTCSGYIGSDLVSFVWQLQPHRFTP
jgi:kumamolisin